MGYSINFYLDNAISEEKFHEAKRTSKILYKELLDTASKKELQIFLYLRYGGKTIKIYIERKCTQNQWDFEKQRVNPNYYKLGSVELNKYIENVSYEAGKIFEANNNKTICTTKVHLKEIVYKLNNKIINPHSNFSFEDAFCEFIKNSEGTKQNTTIMSYKSTITHLKKFSRIKKMGLSFDKIDFKFEDSLRDYFISEVKLTNNTVARYFRVLKTFLNYCLERGYTQNQIFKKFEVKEKQKEVYVLTLEELNRIYTYQFKEGVLNQVKDIFCFSCFTGLRFSDVMNLKRENIQGNQIKIIIQKTQEDLIMPLNEFAFSILEKYLEFQNPLPVITAQKTNQYLREIGKLLNINEPVRTVTYRGNEKIEKYLPKYEILTFHIARKTFITSSLILGMNDRIVKDFSGHRDEVSFRRYVNFADNYKKKIMNNIWSKENIQNAVM
jgi:integrase